MCLTFFTYSQRRLPHLNGHLRLFDPFGCSGRSVRKSMLMSKENMSIYVTYPFENMISFYRTKAKITICLFWFVCLVVSQAESDGNQYDLSRWLKNFKVKHSECRKVLPFVGFFAMRKDRMRFGIFCEDLEQFNCESGDFFLFPFCCF